MSDHNDAALMRKIREPFASANDGNAAMEAFLDDVAAARDKHRISEVYLALSFPYVAEGEETRGIAVWGCGDEMRHEQMAAYAFGTAQADRRVSVNKMITRLAK
jgi:hypothetical protein